MNTYSSEQILSQNLSWNGTRIKFLARFLIALYRIKTVNLAKIASVSVGQAKAVTNYKRLQRFVRFFPIS